MKKLVLSALSVLLLAGCGGASNQVSKTCSVSTGGYDVEVVLKGEDNKLTAMDMSFAIPESLMGIEASDITDDQKKLMEDMLGDQMASTLGIKKDDFSFEFTDDALKMNVNMDIKNLSDEMKNQIGLDNINDFDAAVKDLESNGATCK